MNWNWLVSVDAGMVADVSRLPVPPSPSKIRMITGDTVTLELPPLTFTSTAVSESPL